MKKGLYIWHRKSFHGISKGCRIMSRFFTLFSHPLCSNTPFTAGSLHNRAQIRVHVEKTTATAKKNMFLNLNYQPSVLIFFIQTLALRNMPSKHQTHHRWHLKKYLKIQEFNCFWHFKDYPKTFRWEGISTVFFLKTYLLFIINSELTTVQANYTE